MNDDQAQRMLEGIDAPRPLPRDLRAELLATLTTAQELATADAPRALPDDLRHRLEATLTTATARPLPSRLRRRVLSATTQSTPRTLAAAAAAVLVLVAGIALTARPGSDDGTTQQATRPRIPSQPQGPVAPSAGAATGSGATSAGSGAGDVAADSGADITAGEARSAGGGAAAAPSAGGSTFSGGAGDIAIGVVSNEPTDIATGFHAYLATVNAAGGVGGRRLVTVEGNRGVATVNLGSLPGLDEPKGVVFETVFHRVGTMRGPVISLSSPLERQARLAVADAYPRAASGARVAIYSDGTQLWGDAVTEAYRRELEARGATVVTVVFNPSSPTYLPGVDAAFLALQPANVTAWVKGASNAPTKGVWGIGSALDDRLARRGEQLRLRVMSPYEPIGGDEAAALRAAVPEQALTVGSIHGWVTAKAIVELLRRNGGTTIAETDLDRLTGWDPAWAPAFETRAGTRERTPEAILLRPVDGRFVADGPFRRAD